MLIPWKQGEPFDQRLVDEYRRRLLRTGLFAAVSTTKPDTLSANDELPLTTSLIEGKHRSLGFGAKYATGEGPAGKVFWEHRNLLGRNEDLGVALEAGKITQSAEVTFRRPDFRLPEQDLFVESIATRTNRTAYNELSVETKAGIQRPLGGDWSGSVAGSLEWASLKDQEGTGTLVARRPAAVAGYNLVNNRFNPTKGARLRLETTPYAGWFDQPISFLVNEISGSAYIPLDAERRFVLAGRAKIGSIVGQSRAEIPANKRFYAGGGGDSIRGYKFQDVGLLDDNNDPLGGRSLFETSVELRTRVWGNFGVAPFIDGGNVFELLIPRFRATAALGRRLGSQIHHPDRPGSPGRGFPAEPARRYRRRLPVLHRPRRGVLMARLMARLMIRRVAWAAGILVVVTAAVIAGGFAFLQTEAGGRAAARAVSALVSTPGESELTIARIEPGLPRRSRRRRHHHA